VDVFKIIEFSENSPHANFKSNAKTSKEMGDTLRHFNNFIDNCKKNKSQLKRIRDEINEQLAKSMGKIFDADFKKIKQIRKLHVY